MNKVKEFLASFVDKVRQREKKPLFQFTWKKWHLIGLILLVLLMSVSGILQLVQKKTSENLIDQRMANRWSKDHDYAQVSLFFPYGTELEETDIKGVDYQINHTLEEISMFAENPSQRLFLSCWYSTGSITLTRESATASVEAIGVSGDFFLFHPMEFISGEPIPTNSLMTDYVVLDERTAWNLFGATNVAGMEVRINGIPHIVSGVVKPDISKLSTLAGSKENLIYTTNESLKEYGTLDSAMAFELVMPEPYEGFAMDSLQKCFEKYKDSGEWIDNSKRFEFFKLWKIFKIRKSMVMQTKPVVYPYWENLARFYENKFIGFWEIRIIIYVISSITVILELISIWKMRTFDKEDIKDAWIHMIERMREKRNLRKAKKEEGFL